MPADEYPSAAPPPQGPSADPREGVLAAYVVTGTGEAASLSDPFAAKAPEEGYLWLHLDLGGPIETICERLGLDPAVTKSLTAPETRPRARYLGGGVLVNLRGVNLNEGHQPEDMLSVRCWLEQGRLVTVRKKRSLALERMAARYNAGDGAHRPGTLLIEIIGGLIDLMEPVVDDLSDSLDLREEEARRVGASDALRENVSAMRHDGAIYRRYIGPMRDALLRLASKETTLFTKEDVDQLQEEADRATRMVEELDISIDRARVIVDQMEAVRSERINRNMMFLSVISAVFLPLGFLTGLLGINVGGLPGQEDPRAFGVVVLLCLFIGGCAGVFFKARDWI